MYREDMDLPSTLNAGLRAPLVPSAPDDDDGLDADSLEASGKHVCVCVCVCLVVGCLVAI